MLVLSAPAMTLLTVSELAAILGHELAHMRAGDLFYSVTFARLYRRFQYALQEFGKIADVEHSLQHAPAPLAFVLWPVKVLADTTVAGLVESLLAFVAYPIRWVFGLAVSSFALVERRHSRMREFAADRTAARVAGVAPLVSGLVKVHAAAPIWAKFLQDAVRDVDARLDVSSRVAAFNSMALSADWGIQQRARYDPDGARRTYDTWEAERQTLVALLQQARGALKSALTLDAFAAYAWTRMNASLARTLLEVSQAHPLDSHPMLHERLAAVADGSVREMVQHALLPGSPVGTAAAGSAPALTLLGGMRIEAALPLRDSPF
jgi:Zn-dependent protease with chaperone function